jgi:hypothetical protein
MKSRNKQQARIAQVSPQGQRSGFWSWMLWTSLGFGLLMQVCYLIGGLGLALAFMGMPIPSALTVSSLVTICLSVGLVGGLGGTLLAIFHWQALLQAGLHWRRWWVAMVLGVTTGWSIYAGAILLRVSFGSSSGVFESLSILSKALALLYDNSDHGWERLLDPGPILSLVFGLSIGLSQWIELRRHFSRSLVWLGASALVWAGCLYSLFRVQTSYLSVLLVTAGFSMLYGFCTYLVYRSIFLRHEDRL